MPKIHYCTFLARKYGISQSIMLGLSLLLWSCDDTSKKSEGCGDGLIETGELCDGEELRGATCASWLNHTYAGILRCTANCRYDISDCTSTCGNGLLDGSETCDDGNVTLGDGCSAVCVVEAGWNCTGIPSLCETVCGDNLVVGNEICDDAQLAGQTCKSLGYNGGTLVCQADCTLDSSDCEASGRCGDGVVQMDFEACEGSNLNGHTCMSYGYQGGMLACTSACGLDTSGCTNTMSPNIGELIYVPAGTFQRDSMATNLSVVSAFRMSQFEITRAQWVAVTGWPDPSIIECSRGMDHPVNRMSWYRAIAFCNKLSLLEGLTPVYTVSGVDFQTLTLEQIPIGSDASWDATMADWNANGYRLPTEMEWRWAAMGADTGNPGAVNTTGYGKAFAGSTGTNAMEGYAVCGPSSEDVPCSGDSHTNAVGSKLANELGFHDLSGNIAELAWDRYKLVPHGTLTDYRGSDSGSSRLILGGSFYSSEYECSVAAHCGMNPAGTGTTTGFRVVRN